MFCSVVVVVFCDVNTLDDRRHKLLRYGEHRTNSENSGSVDDVLSFADRQFQSTVRYGIVLYVLGTVDYSMLE